MFTSLHQELTPHDSYHLIIYDDATSSDYEKYTFQAVFLEKIQLTTN